MLRHPDSPHHADATSSIGTEVNRPTEYSCIVASSPSLRLTVNNDPQNVFPSLDGLVGCLLLIVLCSPAGLRDVEVSSAARLAPMQLVVHAWLYSFALPELYAEALNTVGWAPEGISSGVRTPSVWNVWEPLVQGVVITLEGLTGDQETGVQILVEFIHE
uniref:(California timema) hypothetical protein n=1 Tax=Timema californicum TaxID=61474 RepID=A0A7R9JET7_TIMCA|nr:unnamed protein product [Timema californicum]